MRRVTNGLLFLLIMGATVVSIGFTSRNVSWAPRYNPVNTGVGCVNCVNGVCVSAMPVSYMPVQTVQCAPMVSYRPVQTVRYVQQPTVQYQRVVQTVQQPVRKLVTTTEMRPVKVQKWVTESRPVQKVSYQPVQVAQAPVQAEVDVAPEAPTVEAPATPVVPEPHVTELESYADAPVYSSAPTVVGNSASTYSSAMHAPVYQSYSAPMATYAPVYGSAAHGGNVSGDYYITKTRRVLFPRLRGLLGRGHGVQGNAPMTGGCY